MKNPMQRNAPACILDKTASGEEISAAKKNLTPLPPFRPALRPPPSPFWHSSASMASLHPATATLPPRQSLSPSPGASSLSWSASIAVTRIPLPPRLALHSPAPARQGPSNRQVRILSPAQTPPRVDSIRWPR